MSHKKIQGIEKLRTMHSTKQRSIPKMQQSSEIELFLLEKEKERFVKEAERLQVRLRTVYERIEVLDGELEAHQQVRYNKQQEKQLNTNTLKDIQGMIDKQMTRSAEGNEQWNTKKLMY